MGPESLDTIDYDKSKPKVICVETVEYTETGIPKIDTYIRDKLESHGYFYFANSHINSIFVQRELWDKQK